MLRVVAHTPLTVLSSKGEVHNGTTVSPFSSSSVHVYVIPTIPAYGLSSMTFCQVVLNKKIMDSVDKNPYHFDWWKKKVDEHVKQNPRDPIHIPFRDPEPQVTSPFSDGHEWHTQVSSSHLNTHKPFLNEIMMRMTYRIDPS